MNYQHQGPPVVSIDGLEVYGHHGLLPEERELGQVFLFDIDMNLKDAAACEDGDIASTVDYAQVADCVVRTSTAENHDLLERLAAVVAEAILRDFSLVESVRVRASKPAPPVEHAVGSVSVTVVLSRGSGSGR